MWGQYSLRRVGHYPVGSLSQPFREGADTPVREIVGRATKALIIILPENLTAAASRFEAEAEESLRSVEIPLLPDFKDLLCRQLTSP